MKKFEGQSTPLPESPDKSESESPQVSRRSLLKSAAAAAAGAAFLPEMSLGQERGQEKKKTQVEEDLAVEYHQLENVGGVNLEAGIPLESQAIQQILKEKHNNFPEKVKNYLTKFSDSLVSNYEDTEHGDNRLYYKWESYQELLFFCMHVNRGTSSEGKSGFIKQFAEKDPRILLSDLANWAGGREARLLLKLPAEKETRQLSGQEKAAVKMRIIQQTILPYLDQFKTDTKEGRETFISTAKKVEDSLRKAGFDDTNADIRSKTALQSELNRKRDYWKKKLE